MRRAALLLLSLSTLALPARGEDVTGRWRGGDLVVDLAEEARRAWSSSMAR